MYPPKRQIPMHLIFVRPIFVLLAMSVVTVLDCSQGFERYLPKEPVKHGPKIISSTPAHEASNVAPDPVNHIPADTATRIRVVFDKTIDTSVTPQFNAYSHNISGGGTVWYSISTAGATFAWSSTNVSNDTLTVTLPWVRYPENNRIGFDLTPTSIKDTEGLPLETTDKKYFTTGFNTGRYPVVKTSQYQCYYHDGTKWTEDSTDGCTGQTYSSTTTDYPARQNGHFDGTALFTNKRFPISTHPTNVVALDCNGLSTDTNCMPYSVDSVTNLRWKTCAQGQAYDENAGDKCVSVGTEDFSWGEAVNACSALNTQNAGVGYSGRTDWRLPTIDELETLVDYGMKFEMNSITDRPTIHGYRRDNFDMEGPYPNTAVEAFWSSTGVAIDSVGGYSNAWNVEFKNGHAGLGGGATALLNSDRITTNRKRVRCVAGPTVTPTVRTLTDNLDGTVSDNAASLMWKKCKIGYNDDATCSDNVSVDNTQKWYNALNRCAELNFAGHTDWRMPHINELKSLNDRTLLYAYSRSLDTSLFLNTNPTGEVFWSATTKVVGGVPATTNYSTAWAYSFVGGITFVNEKGQSSNILTGNSYSVLCVRNLP